MSPIAFHPSGRRDFRHCTAEANWGYSYNMYNNLYDPTLELRATFTPTCYLRFSFLKTLHLFSTVSSSTCEKTLPTQSLTLIFTGKKTLSRLRYWGRPQIVSGTLGLRPQRNRYGDGIFFVLKGADFHICSARYVSYRYRKR